MKIWFAKAGLKEIGLPARNPDLNPTGYFCDKFEHLLHTSSSYPAYVHNFGNTLVSK